MFLPHRQAGQPAYAAKTLRNGATFQKYVDLGQNGS
jgi:hypothetical protein